MAEMAEVEDHLTSQLTTEMFNSCDHEALHEIGAIQSGAGHGAGYVLAVRVESPTEIVIQSISENLVEASWMPIKEASKIMGQNLFTIFESGVSMVLANLIARFQSFSSEGEDNPARSATILRMLCKGAIASVSTKKQLCCSVVGYSRGIFVLELEDVDETTATPRPAIGVGKQHNVILEYGDALGRIRAQENVAGVTAAFCDAVMDILPGFDRGMVYRFAGDLSGEIIHERTKAGSSHLLKSSFLNLRFPAGDIPKPMRELYLKTGLRFIIDVESKNHKIITTDPEAKVDLTMSCFRAVSPVHLVYLRNMGVKSSMSIAIVVNEQLWGIYALHSCTKAVKPTWEQRIILEMMASISAMRIGYFENEEAQRRKLNLSTITVQMATAASLQNFLKVFAHEILDILRAQLIVVYSGGSESNGKRMIFGDATMAPTEEGIELLQSQAKMNTIRGIHAFTHGLSGRGAGVLFFKHHTASIAFVRQQVAGVRWGGKPDKIPGPNGRLKPRASFEKFEESAKDVSEIWSAEDLELGKIFCERVANYTHDEMLNTFRLTLDQSNQECMEAIESAQQQYEFFAHMSHELRTPFHGVTSSLEILKSGWDRIEAEERVEIIDSALESGRSMLRTLDDILTIAKSKNCVETVRKPLLFPEVTEGTRRAMGRVAENKGVQLKVEHVCSLSDRDLRTQVVMLDETRMGQIANNLSSNAIKFTDAGGCVTLRANLASPASTLQRWQSCRARFKNFHVNETASQKKITSMQRDRTRPAKKRRLEHNGSDSNLSSSSGSLDTDGKASPSIPEVTEITAEALRHSEAWYVLEVEDDGCGVSLEGLQVMFDAYKQVSSGVSKTYQGTGLGLHICTSHVDSTRGIIGVLSEVGRGTLFFVAIPTELPGVASPKILSTGNGISEEGDLEDPPVAPLAKGPKETRGPLLLPDSRSPTTPRNTGLWEMNTRNAHFVIVDDSSTNLRLAKRKVQLAFGNEIRVTLCEDGLEAIALYEDLLAKGEAGDKVTGIIMDYHMPKCNGLDAIVEVRRLEKAHGLTSEVYIAAFTADLSETTRHDLLAAGSNNVLPKPSPVGYLEALCASLIKGERPDPLPWYL